MQSRRLFSAATAAVVLGLAGGSPAEALAPPKTVIFNMFSSALIEPDRIFFQANSGPYLKDLKWTGWGTERAVGTGTYILDCSSGGVSCGSSTAVTTHPATYTLTELVPCPRLGAGAQSYRKGVVEIDRAERRTVNWPSDYDFCAKRPTLAQARQAITRHLRSRNHNPRGLKILSVDAGDTNIDCRVRWTHRGRRYVRSFGVFGRMNGRPGVSPFGSS